MSLLVENWGVHLQENKFLGWILWTYVRFKPFLLSSDGTVPLRLLFSNALQVKPTLVHDVLWRNEVALCYRQTPAAQENMKLTTISLIRHIHHARSLINFTESTCRTDGPEIALWSESSIRLKHMTELLWVSQPRALIHVSWYMQDTWLDVAVSSVSLAKSGHYPNSDN